MVELSLDAAGARLSFNPYGARGRCRHGDGPVLQHRPDQLFDDKWSTYPGITRKFWSFSEAARENGASRILCGIHFRTAVEVGYAQRERVGEWVFEHALRPAKPGPATTPFPESG
jgi:hypothetical protein